MNSPFNQEQAELLNRLLPTFTESQKVWLSGYLAGAASAPIASVLGVPSQQTADGTASKEVTILYGSQTGNARGLAKKASTTLEGKGFQVTVSAMSDFKPNNIKKVKNLLILVSTHGEGDPPDNALTFHEFLHGKRAPKLEDLNFSVLSLGDSSYEFFCQTGKQFDARLEELGGTRLYPRFDCDLDYDEPAAEWVEGIISSLGEAKGGIPAQAQAASTQTVESTYSRTNPFRAEVLDNLNLNGRGSNKETRHLELSLEGSGISFQPGDSLGIYPENDPELVDLLLAELKWNPEESVTINKQGEVLSLRDALTTHYEITTLTKPLLEKAAKLTGNSDLQELINDSEKVKSYLEGHDLLDVVRDFGPLLSTPQEFVSILRKMPARLYSIASSLTANPD
jgi:sulfite reductase (NADPH) flavoprotein alpha-component